MKQAGDIKTLEIPGSPVMKKRGRPALGAAPMTAAERKRRSRLNAARVDTVLGQDSSVKVVTVDAEYWAAIAFAKCADTLQITQADLFSRMVDGFMRDMSQKDSTG